MRLSLSPLDPVVFVQQLMPFDPNFGLVGSRGYVVSVNADNGAVQVLLGGQLVEARVVDLELDPVRS